MKLAQIPKSEPPRIFISHAWEDKTLVRRLETALKAAGAEVWVDHVGVRGGDNLPERISEALDWCDTLVLVWSQAAANSRWVKLEWTNAISLDKHIVPCPCDKTALPSILAHKAYVDFSDAAPGVQELLRALQLTPPMSVVAPEPTASPTSLPHSPLIATVPPPAPKPRQDEPAAKPRQNKPPVAKPMQTARPAIIQLRHTPINPLSEEAAKQMLREKDFYDSAWNASAKGLAHQYESLERNGARLVIDHATGLTWQQSGPENYMPFEKATDYIRQLNAKNYGGHADWRLPTLEEAMSLMESKMSGDLYIDAKFDAKQWWIWTADIFSAGRAWFVGFIGGFCHPSDVGMDSSYVRAVRS